MKHLSEGIICPCCNKKRTGTNKISQFISQIKNGNRKFVSNVPDENAYLATALEYQGKGDYLSIKWACNQCINAGTAIKSTTYKYHQRGVTAPIYAFFDLNKKCKKCRKKFIFRKEEWAHWIDKLNFYYQAERVYCDNCQPKEKISKKLNRLIARKSNLEFSEEYVNLVLEISEAYFELGLLEKAKGYLKVVLNEHGRNNNTKLVEKLRMAYNKRG